MERSMNKHLDKFSEGKSEVAVLQLYDRANCLIIQLQGLSSLPNSFFNFLQLPDFTFVSIGIKESMLKLEKEFGVGCKNEVDVRQLAADVMGKPYLVSCGVDVLAQKVLSLRLDKPTTSAVFDNWGAEVINKKHIKFEVINK